MLRPIHVMAKLFANPKDTGDAERSRRAMTWLMFGIVNINREYLDFYPGTPRLYESRVVYQPEVDTEDWQDIPTTLERGYGDCEDLAMYRCAELWAYDNVPALPYVTWRPDKQGVIFHALVRWPDGRIEDPSLALGMRGHPITRRPEFIGVHPT